MTIGSDPIARPVFNFCFHKQGDSFRLINLVAAIPRPDAPVSSWRHPVATLALADGADDGWSAEMRVEAGRLSGGGGKVEWENREIRRGVGCPASEIVGLGHPFAASLGPV